MRLSSPARSLKRSSLELAEQLERLRLTLELDPRAWCEVLGTAENEYRRMVQGQLPLSLRCVESAAEYSGLSLEHFMARDIDFATIAARRGGDTGYLRDRYSKGAFSKRRVSINLLGSIEEFLGWRVKMAALRRLQVSEAAFRDPDQLISIHFNTDLLDYVHRNGCTDEQLFAMGAFSVISYSNSPVGKALSSLSDVPQMFELMIEELLPKFIEKNSIYRIHTLDSGRCVFDVFTNTDVLDALGERKVGSHAICQSKAGVTAAIPAYSGLPFAAVEEILCVHHGDAFCRFEVDFQVAAVRLKENREPRLYN
jgi:hypothetical protein